MATRSAMATNSKSAEDENFDDGNNIGVEVGHCKGKNEGNNIIIKVGHSHDNDDNNISVKVG
jgi:hypothetical protein